jgi:hypothetical protein
MDLLPQQRLLLELMVMSGDIAVTSLDNNTILWRTLEECQKHGWLTMRDLAPGYKRAILTTSGRAAAKMP